MGGRMLRGLTVVGAEEGIEEEAVGAAAGVVAGSEVEGSAVLVEAQMIRGIAEGVVGVEDDLGVEDLEAEG